MDTIPFWGVILGISGGIVTILTAIKEAIKAGKAVNKTISAPNEEQNRKIAILEDECEKLRVRCDKFDEYFSADKHRMDTFEQSLSVLMQAQFALLSHAINGNDIDNLKKVHENMMAYLTKRGISV